LTYVYVYVYLESDDRRTAVPRAKTLYVRDEDATAWDEAIKAAAEEGVSMSEFVIAAVRDRLDRRNPLVFEEISVQSTEPLTAGTAYKATHTFRGRWILKDVRSNHPGASPNDVWSIAITEGGFFAVHVLRGGDVPLLGTNPSFADLANSFGIPADVAEAAVDALSKTEWVIHRDI
jgi:hypothetical protein